MIAMTTTAQPHQVDTWDRLNGVSGILDAGMGTGKTRSAIELMTGSLQSHALPGHVPRALIVSPLAALKHLQREIGKHTNLNSAHDAFIYHGPSRNSGLMYTRATFVIAGYSSVLQDYKRYEDNRPYPGRFPYGVLSMYFTQVVFDEAHNLRNRGAKIHRACSQISAGIRLCMSGTPMVNGASDMYSLAEICHLPIDDYTTVDEWKEMHHVHIPASVVRLPGIEHRVARVDFTEQQLVIYNALKLQSLELLANYMVDHSRHALAEILAMITRLRQASIHHQVVYTTSPNHETIEDSGKTLEICGLVAENIVNDEKTVVFSSSVRALNIIKTCIDADMPECTLMYIGSMNQGERESVLDEFREDPSKMVLLMSINAGGVGIEMTEANNVIIADPWWNSAIEEQAIARCYRMGQTRPVTVTRIITQDSLEEWIELLKMKKDNDIRQFYGLGSIGNTSHIMEVFRMHISGVNPNHPEPAYVPFDMTGITIPMEPAFESIPTDRRANITHHLEPVECAVCLGHKKEIVETVCGHRFCTGCYISWDRHCSAQHSRTNCPLCRHQL